MAHLQLRNVTRNFGGNSVVKNVTLNIHDKELFVLVGPSGCGKSTTLRMIAGLEEPSEGEILVDGQSVLDVDSKDRNIAMVFQNHALYPHLTVYENMAFGLSVRHYSKGEIDARIRETASLLNITPLLQRNPRTLSGGERQRVAVGRAIMRKPKVFLFDEPLSDLDAKMRLEMRAELLYLQKRLQTTMIYVTHDQTEAMTLGDRIGVMMAGTIQQVARPLELYEFPRNRLVAEFIGQPAMNFFDMTVVVKDRSIWLDQGHFQLKLPPRFTPEHLFLQNGQKLMMGMRAQHIRDKLFQPGMDTDGREVLAMVELLEPLGSETYAHLRAGGGKFIARIDPYHPVQINQPIEVVFNMDKVLLFTHNPQGTRIEI
jgi:multiple sugar transport system ATP-binding protein